MMKWEPLRLKSSSEEALHCTYICDSAVRWRVDDNPAAQIFGSLAR